MMKGDFLDDDDDDDAYGEDERWLLYYDDDVIGDDGCLCFDMLKRTTTMILLISPLQWYTDLSAVCSIYCLYPKAASNIDVKNAFFEKGKDVKKRGIKNVVDKLRKWKNSPVKLLSYNVHDSILELWLFIREFPITAMLNPSLKSFFVRA